MADTVQKYRSIQIHGYIGNGRHYAKRHKSIQIDGYIGDGRHNVQKYTANYPDSRLHWRWQTLCIKRHSKLSRLTATLEMADTMYKNTQQIIQIHGYNGDGRRHVQKCKIIH